MKNFEKGSSFTELLVALSMFSLVTALCLPSLRTLYELSERIYARYYLAQRLDTVDAAITDGAKAASRLTATKLAFQNTRDQLTTKKQGSDSFSFFSIVPRDFYQRAFDRAAIFCSSLRHRGRHNNYWLGFTIDDIWILHGDMLALAQTAGSCGAQFPYRLNARPSALQISTQAAPANLVGALYSIIAIDDAYTLFLDKQDVLRRKSLRTSENQPLLRGVHELNHHQDTLQLTIEDHSGTLHRVEHPLLAFTNNLNRGFLDVLF